MDVTQTREVEQNGRIQLPGAHDRFDVKLMGDEKWVAAALYYQDSLALFSVIGEHIVELSRFQVSSPRLPLFCFDSLLMCREAAPGGDWELQLFSTREGQLKMIRPLLKEIRFEWFSSWCLMNKYLVAWNREYHNLAVYSIT